MHRVLAVLIVALAAACSAPTTGAAAPQHARLHVLGFGGDGERSAILVQNADNTLTQCFFAAGQISHCSSTPAPNGVVAGYTATGSGDRSTGGDMGEVLVRGSDGGFSQCVLARGALSPCTPLAHIDGAVVGYEYFADAPSLVLQQGASFRECALTAGHLRDCTTLPALPGQIVGYTPTGEDESALLLARTDGSYEQCFIGGGRLNECTTFSTPAHVAGYEWRTSGPAILLERDDGSLSQCILGEHGLDGCAALPAWPS